MPRFLQKHIAIIICLLLWNTNSIFSQTQATGIFFQAIARDNAANPAKERKIYVESTIRQYTSTGNIMLTEVHETKTDATGIFGITIGQGNRIGGTALNIISIPWEDGPFYLGLKIAISPTAPVSYWDYSKEWIDLGSTPFGAVPYALFAANVAGMDKKLNILDSNHLYVTPYQLKLKTFDTASLSNRIDQKLNSSEILNVYDKINLKLNSSDTIKFSSKLEYKLNAADTIGLSNRIGIKLNFSDTANMLIPYLRSDRLTEFLSPKINYTDTSAMLSNRIARDTVVLSNRIDLKLNIADTSTMLNNRFTRDTAALSNRINLKLNAVDTSNMLSPYFKSSFLENHLNTKLNIIDTSSMFSNRIARDTIALSGRINLKLNITDTSDMLSKRFARDTAALSSRINLKINIADTSVMLNNRFARDTISLSDRINLKLNSVDTSEMLTPYFKTAFLNNYLNSKINNIDTSAMLSNRIARDTIALSDRINLKINIADTSVMINNRFARDTVALSDRINLKLNITDTSDMLSSRIARDTVALSDRINLKEDAANKSLDIAIDGLLDTKFPSTKAVKTFVDNSINAINYLSPNGTAIHLTNFPILNQNTSGSAASLSNAFIDWNAASGGAAILNKPILFSGSYNDLSNSPILFSGAYADLTGKPALFSGSYSDLTAKPNLFSGSYYDLSNKPTLFSGVYNDLTGKPNLFSGSYNDLSNIPNFFSGAYSDLTGKPTLFSGAYSDLTGKPVLTIGTVTNVNNLIIGNTGTDINSSIANGTTTPTITLNIPTASITNRGLLSSSDWALFNAKGDVTLTGIQTITGTKTFSNTIIASISGNAATATKLATPVTINGSSFDGSADISFSTNTVNSLSFNNGGSGDVSGSSFNGSAVKTISYNTIGAAPAAGSASITTLGTIASGTWNATTISVAKGGTGATTLTTNAILLGNGTSPLNSVAPSTSGNVLTSDGTTWVSSSPSVTLIREVANEFIATNTQTTFTLTQTPSVNSKVKMYINGVRISNTAYSLSGPTLTYNATNNGAYSLMAGDRIQFDYYY